MSEKRFQNGIGDGMFCEDDVNLFNSKVNLIQSLPEGFNLLGQALELGAVNHVAQPSELLGVEEARDGVCVANQVGNAAVT